MMSKDELMKTLWPDSFVDEANLTQQISLIRKALGDVPGKDRYIVTVPGRGYRFAGAVTEERPHEIAPLEVLPPIPVPAPVPVSAPAPILAPSRERRNLIP